jgi:hypothetical protein
MESPAAARLRQPPLAHEAINELIFTIQISLQHCYKKHMSNDPLHGITLERMLTDLVKEYGWEDLAFRIKINCFSKDPSIKSSLKFLRKTDWARNKVEILYKQFLGLKDPERRI